MLFQFYGIVNGIIQEKLNSFIDRLTAVLADRDKHPWGTTLGIGRGTVGNMFSGTVPTSETLNAISRHENVNITWLLDGRGEPYNVHKFPDDEECVEYLDSLFDEKSWTVYLVTDQKRLALVLTMPAQYKVKEEWISYSVVEILAGRCGRKTLNRVRAEIPACEVFIINAYSQTLTDLSRGNIGTYKLLHSNPPLLHQDVPVTKDHKIFDWPEETILLTPEEHVLVENFRHMAAEQRTAYKSIGDALAQSKKDKLAS
ncbi:hypothetical protein [Nitrosospira sp. Nsp1]|uniref:hypothetical protein n=1 Tax=Nitrosospira sp. Nsp1 TaxID=136547 RepID=UPI00088E243B|nr:hypothetical protein [Nitrosospira sp. Nsp1]SCX40522.1 hypothetical protein SAMN05720354_103124 [Nitrosospira sp. Nsp1]